MNKFTSTKANEICRHFDFQEEARPLLREIMTPREFLDALVHNRQYQIAVQFLAHALPAREAVWWAGLCMEHVFREKWKPEDKAACKAAVQWVLDPSEENRQATKAPAEAAGLGSPAGSLAMAASWTGGSLSPADLPPVPPDPHLPPKPWPRP
jgi:hypothetical protein